jgi:hypothetical protein
VFSPPRWTFAETIVSFGSGLKTTQNEIRFSNNRVIKAIASDYKGAAAGANA